jgi:mitochondrial import receptor subunit TOM20
MVGPHMHLNAAQHFYKALKVYPNTAELLDIYKKTVPEVSPARVMLIVGRF